MAAGPAIAVSTDAEEVMRPAGVNQRALTMGSSQTTNRGVRRLAKAPNATDDLGSSVRLRYPAPCVGSSPSPKILPASRPDRAAPWNTRPRGDELNEWACPQDGGVDPRGTVSAVVRRHTCSSAVLTRIKPNAQPRLTRLRVSANYLRLKTSGSGRHVVSGVVGRKANYALPIPTNRHGPATPPHQQTREMK